MARYLRAFIVLVSILTTHYSILSAQESTFKANGPDDYRDGVHAFINATLYKDYKTKIDNGILVIKDGKIIDAGAAVSIPLGAIVHDMKGKYIYPSFIDMYTDYGLPATPKVLTRNEDDGGVQYFSNLKGAYGWNQAIRSDYEAQKNFTVNEAAANDLRKQGFGTVLTHHRDGIARGTGAVVTLNNDKENKVVVKGTAAALYSFSKGTSTQEYPSSLMGSIALLRQTYLDAQWYKGQTDKREYNLSMEAWNSTQSLPQIFEAGNWQKELRADKIGKEFGVQYLLKGDGTEYRRIAEIKDTKAKIIVPVNFPKAYDVEDPYKALWVELDEMKHWELAPANAAALSKAGIDFALTTSDLEKKEDFLKNLRTAIRYGLSEESALKALTIAPAQFLNVQDQVGSLDRGKLANFIITSKPLVDEKCVINENWIQGKRFETNKFDPKDIRGEYSLAITNPKESFNYLSMKVQGEVTAPKGVIAIDTNKVEVKLVVKDNDVSLSFDPDKKKPGKFLLTGVVESNKSWKGKAQLPDGEWADWTATFIRSLPDTSKPPKPDTIDISKLSRVMYPFNSYGNEELPKTENVIIKNATVWTNEKDGVLKNADLVIKGGKISAVGYNLSCPDCQTIIATGKNVTSGIIDEHNHIAISEGVNEGSEASSSEVRIGDVVTSEDVNMYRQLSGGVTAAQLLHGSANPIGGQSALIKFRWGYAPEKLKIEGADGFIKFALGENVKQSNWGEKFTVRYPQSRMGVEQTYVNYFTKAREYEKAIKEGKNVRKDLMLDALVQILNKKRFITCHSYVQSEINMLMHVADSFGFKVNTFTHILEGYKVADKMKAHGANASTFSDWWAYKYEVIDAIPYNANILTRMGINTAINSDDAEMARRLNQEAAKTVKYGGTSEEDAWKMVTLNPAKMLHLDSHMGSLKAGKDADVVIWSDNPLSIYAVVERTYVDGICFYDKGKDAQKREYIKHERARLAQKMLDEKRVGAPTQDPAKKNNKAYSCGND
ncbi:MAG: amidohydrolase [Bacteroidetes bacterium]|nr:amidohydrolase [Bacteroidota bacterium]